MNKKEIIDELHKMGYEVKEETLVKNGVNVLGVNILMRQSRLSSLD